MISNVDNDNCCCCCGGDSRVITDCKEPTGRGGFKGENRARRWSNASLAWPWKHTRRRLIHIPHRSDIYSFNSCEYKKKKDTIVIHQCRTQPGVVRVHGGGGDDGVYGRRRTSGRQWDENSDRLARHSLGKINTSPFLPCTTPISLTTLPSHSLPFRKCSLIIQTLMCYSAFSLFVLRLQMTTHLPAYFHDVQIKQNLKMKLDDWLLTTMLPSPAQTYNEGVFKYSTMLLVPLRLMGHQNNIKKTVRLNS